jgi:hypothetical protein
VGDAPQSTEVISTYTFDARGKIYEHVVDQIIPPESLPVRQPTHTAVHELTGAAETTDFEGEPTRGPIGNVWHINLLLTACVVNDGTCFRLLNLSTGN